MFYVCLGLALVLIIVVYFKDKSFINYQAQCIDDLEQANRNLRQKMSQQTTANLKADSK